MNLLRSIRARVAALVAFSVGPVSGSISNFLNARELLHAILTAVGVSSLAGLAVAVLTAISADAAAIFPAPLLCGLAVYAIAQAVESLRRLDHAKPTPASPALFTINPSPPASVLAAMTPSPAVRRFDDLPASESYRDGLLERARRIGEAAPANPVVDRFLAAPSPLASPPTPTP